MLIPFALVPQYLDRVLVKRQLFVGNLERDAGTVSLKTVGTRLKAIMPLDEFLGMEDPQTPPDKYIQ